MFSLFADPDNTVPNVKMNGFQVYFVEDFVSQQLQIKTILVYTGNQQDAVVLYQYPTGNVPYISSLPNVKTKKTEYGNLLFFEFHQVGLKIVHCSKYNLELMQDYITLQKFNVIDKIPFSIKPLNEATLFKMNHLYKLQLSVDNYRTYLNLMLQILSCCIKIFGINVPSCSFFSNALLNSFQASVAIFSDQLVLHCTPKWFAFVVSKVMSYNNKMNVFLKDEIKDPFSETQALLKSISNFQKNKDLNRSGYLDVKTMAQIDITYSKHKERHIPNKIKLKLEDLSGLSQKVLLAHVDTIEELLENQLPEKLGILWSKNEREVEGLLRGGKEFGKSLIKNVQSKTLIPDGEKVLSLSHPLNPLIKKRKSSGKSSSEYPEPMSPSSMMEPLKVLKIHANQTHYDVNELNLIAFKAKSTDNLIKHQRALRRTFSTSDITLLLDSEKQESDKLLLSELNDLFSVLSNRQDILAHNMNNLQQLEKELALEKEELAKKCNIKKATTEHYEKIVNALMGIQSKVMVNVEENSKRLQQAKYELDQFESDLAKVEETVAVLSSKIADNEATEQLLIKSAKHTSILQSLMSWITQRYFKATTTPITKEE